MAVQLHVNKGVAFFSGQMNLAVGTIKEVHKRVAGVEVTEVEEEQVKATIMLVGLETRVMEAVPKPNESVAFADKKVTTRRIAHKIDSRK